MSVVAKEQNNLKIKEMQEKISFYCTNLENFRSTKDEMSVKSS